MLVGFIAINSCSGCGGAVFVFGLSLADCC